MVTPQDYKQTNMETKDYNILSTASRMLTQTKLDEFDEQSETVAGQSLTVQEVLQRFSNGTLPNIVQPVYHEDEVDFDDYDITLNPAFDMVDAENYLLQQQYIKQEREEKNKNKSLQNKNVNPETKSETNEKTQNNEEEQ